MGMGKVVDASYHCVCIQIEGYRDAPWRDTGGFGEKDKVSHHLASA